MDTANWLELCIIYLQGNGSGRLIVFISTYLEVFKHAMHRRYGRRGSITTTETRFGLLQTSLPSDSHAKPTFVPCLQYKRRGLGIRLFKPSSPMTSSQLFDEYDIIIVGSMSHCR